MEEFQVVAYMTCYIVCVWTWLRKVTSFTPHTMHLVIPAMLLGFEGLHSTLTMSWMSSSVQIQSLRSFVLFCFTKNPSIFSHLAHFDFKLLHTLVVVVPRYLKENVTIPSKFGNMTCLRYLRLEGDIFGKLPNSIVKLTRLETIDIDRYGFIQLPSGVWKSKQLRHLCYKDYGQASNSCFSIS